MGAKRVVTGTILLLVWAVACAGAFSPPGKTTATGQPVGTAGPDEPIDTTPVDKTAQPPAEAGDKPKPTPKPAMSDETLKRLLADVKKAVLQGPQTNAQRAKAFEKTANAAGDKRMQAALLEEAARHGLAGVPDSTCCDVVEKALGRLETLAPDRAGEWKDLRIEFYRHWYRGTSDAARKRDAAARLLEFVLGDAEQHEKAREWAKAAEAYGEARSIASFLKRGGLKAISQRHTRARHLASAQRTVQGYTKVLSNSPDNVAVRLKLLTTFVVDLDDPAKAAGHLTDDVGPHWNRYVPLAAQPVARVAVGDCKELGDWYYKLLLKQAVSSYSKVNVLSRAKMYYECSLRKPGLADSGKLLVNVDLGKVQGQLQKLPKPAKLASPGEPKEEDEWSDLLAVPDKLTRSSATPTQDGIRIGNLSTVQPVAVPFVAEFVAKTDSTGLRLSYGEKVIVIFNWEVRPDELRLRDFRTGKVWALKGRGQVPVNTWVRISLAASETRTEVFVDGQLRGKLNGNYKGLSEKLSIHSTRVSVVTVKAFCLRKRLPSVR